MVSDYEALIKDLNKASKSVLPGTFRLDRSGNGSANVIIYRSEGGSYAINRLDSDDEKYVMVSEWFDDYYIYVKVTFVLKEKARQKTRKHKVELSQCSIWISVFKNILDTKTQLFRVEWDEYDRGYQHSQPPSSSVATANPSDGNDQYSHPQPHWHITLNTAIAKNFEDFLKDFNEPCFEDSLSDQGKSELPPLEKFHFAMGWNWEKEPAGCVSMTSNEQVVAWYNWILSSIKNELKPPKK